MDVKIPLVVLLAVLVCLAVRFLKLRLWQAIVCAVFGFLLAATTLAPELERGLRGLLSWLSRPDLSTYLRE